MSGAGTAVIHFRVNAFQRPFVAVYGKKGTKKPSYHATERDAVSRAQGLGYKVSFQSDFYERRTAFESGYYVPQK